MKYPGVVLKGRKARGEVISIALANDGQHQDTGAKMIHAADETTSQHRLEIHLASARAAPPIAASSTSRSTSRAARTTPSATRCSSTQQPHRHLSGHHRARHRQRPQHEASVSQVSAEQIFYMQQRGLTEAQAMSLARERLRQRPRPPVPDGILRRAEAPHRPRNGRLGRVRDSQPGDHEYGSFRLQPSQHLHHRRRAGGQLDCRARVLTGKRRCGLAPRIALRAAWQKFEALPMPARTDEAWRFASLKALDLVPLLLIPPLPVKPSARDRAAGPLERTRQ